MLFVEGYFVKDCPDVIRFLMDDFQRRNKKIVFTLSATFMIQFFYDIVKEVSDRSDIIFCNREEAEVFAKMTDKDSIDDISLAIHRLLKTNKNRILIITCGCDPVTASGYDPERDSLDYVLHSTVFKVPNEEIVDTNGCGDAYVGGFLSQYVQGKSLEKCLRAV